MPYAVRCACLNGTIISPRSKSCTQRLYALAALNKGFSTRILHPSQSQDDIRALRIIRQMGVQIRAQNTESIHLYTPSSPAPRPAALTLYCGESGFASRVFPCIAALSEQLWQIDACAGLKKRPLQSLLEVLQQLRIRTQNNTYPYFLQGPMQLPTAFSIDGAWSSQLLSGLLLAISAHPRRPPDFTLHVQQLNSRPYIDLTLSYLKSFDIAIKNNNYASFTFPANAIIGKNRTLNSACDWSGCAFLSVGAALNGNIIIQKINKHTPQGDKIIIDILQKSGAHIAFRNQDLHIRSAPLRAFTYDATQTPDLVPPLAVLGCGCEGISRIHGIHRLQHKESPRADALCQELKKLGARIYVRNDTMHIEGKIPLNGARCHSHNDHRIAMTLAIASLLCTEAVLIDNPTCVAKSYPRFFEDLQQLGAQVTTVS